MADISAKSPQLHDHDHDQDPHQDDDQQAGHAEAQQFNTAHKTRKRYVLLLSINYMCLFIGSISSSLLSKFYFIHKGSSRWVSTWVQSAGFPLLLVPIYLPYYILKCTQRRPFSGFSPRMLLLSLLIGLLLGLNNLLFSWGNSYLPVSTCSLLLSSQLAFTLLFSVVLVKQKVTFQNLNCVVLLTLSSVLLALSSSHDRPQGLTRGQYFLGFFSTIGAGLLFSLYLPVMEMIYRRKVYCYAMVMEMQLVMEIAATALATAGMMMASSSSSSSSSDGGSGYYSEMKNESTRVFDLGARAYWMTVGFNVVTWQLCFLGTAGLLFLTTSLTGGMCMTALMGMNVVSGVLVYGDDFGGVKVVSTLLCGWGFSSYMYGIYLTNMTKLQDNQHKRINVTSDDHQPQLSTEMTEIVTPT